MALVKLYIEKFGREVLIDDSHPLAVAEKAKALKPARAPRRPRNQQQDSE